jgi:hypothetical protein
MHTLHGIRFVPVLRVDGVLLGLDARWLGARGLGLMLLLTLATPAGPLSQDSSVALWLRVLVGLCWPDRDWSEPGHAVRANREDT